MAKAAFDELKAAKPRTSFTLGINDDVSHTSLTIDERFQIEKDDVTRAVFYGLGADGTVGANKNSVKILAEDAGRFAQGYFVYDSHKSGAQTISHLRFGPDPIHAPYPRQLSSHPETIRGVLKVRTQPGAYKGSQATGRHGVGVHVFVLWVVSSLRRVR